MEEQFIIPVPTADEGARVLAILASYDLFQFHTNIKPDFSNTGGLQIYDAVDKEWWDWEDDHGEELKDPKNLQDYFAWRDNP